MGIGARIWDAGVALATLLGDDPATAEKRIVELGSGTGIAGLSAAFAGADVVLTDRSDVMALLNQNIARNGLDPNFMSLNQSSKMLSRVVSSELLWGQGIS